MSARVVVEAGTRHALVWCRDCAPFRRLVADGVEGHLRAAEHATAVHDDAQAAADHRRHAAAARTMRG